MGIFTRFPFAGDDARAKNHSSVCSATLAGFQLDDCSCFVLSSACRRSKGTAIRASPRITQGASVMLNQDSGFNQDSVFKKDSGSPAFSVRVVRNRCHDEFERRVDECSRLAAAARNESDRAFWLGLVERWRVVESRRPIIVPRRQPRLRVTLPEG
jgi:hypothetical protein